MAFTPINNSTLAGMFGGKLAQPTTPAAPAGLPSYLGGGQSMTYPQAMPGQLEAIAAQLSAGFGQPASAYMGQMDALYNPVQVGQAPTPTPAAPAPSSPATPQPGGSRLPVTGSGTYSLQGIDPQQLQNIFARTTNRGGSR
jgi:hypothetical protein